MIDQVINTFLTDVKALLGNPEGVFTVKAYIVTQAQDTAYTETLKEVPWDAALVWLKSYPGKQIRGQLYLNSDFVHIFNLKMMPGCCGVCISYNVNTFNSYKLKGINRRAHQLRQDLARLAGFSLLLCTYIQDGATEKVTSQAGFTAVPKFINKRTMRHVTLAYKVL